MRYIRSLWLPIVAVIALTVAAMAPLHTARAQSMGTLKLGVLLPITGPFAALGAYTKEGLELYLKQHNGELGGRKVELFYADDTNVPQVGITQLRKLVEENHIDVLFGPVAANVGAAVIPLIEQNKLPTVWPIVSDDDVTQRKPVDYIVRTGWTSSQTTHVLGDYAFKTLGYKSAATIAYDFNFGWQSIQGFADTFMTDGGKIDKELWTPIANTDFSSYFSSLPRNVDVVMCSFSGQTAINFFKQYREFGMKNPLVCQGNATDESTLEAEGPAAEGVVTALQYSPQLDTKANKAFVAAYKATFGHIPGYYGEGGYVGAEFLDKGLQITHGNTSDAIALVKAMHGVSLPDAPRGPISFDSYGNPVENVYIRKVEMVNGTLENVVIKTYPKVSQFWTWSPQDYLARPAYGRSSPPCNACG